MSKERFLTVMVPIKDTDCEATVYASVAALQSAVPASASNIDKIYKVTNGTYYRSAKSGNNYAYAAVTDREFPYLGQPLYIYDFTYDATRMGNAPTISAHDVMRFAEKDASGYDMTLDELWSFECFVEFNGEKFHSRRTPNIKKGNDDARYKYDIEFVSDRVVLEHTYFYDVVSPFVTERPVSESSTFSFYGDINELAKRLNASLIRSGLAKLERKYVNYPQYMTDRVVPYLTYEQWNLLDLDYQKLLDEGVFPPAPDEEIATFYFWVYAALGKDYNRYLMEYIFVNDEGDFETDGYKVVIGKDKKGETSTSEEKLLSFDNNTIHEALQAFHDEFELDYYVTMERDQYGDFTGDTLIMVADCEHDFADWDEENDDYVRGGDGIPISTEPFDYGAVNELLSKEKNAKNEKLVTRITGVGSSENLPWHYPNPTPDGWIKPVYKINGVEQPTITIAYPKNDASLDYEKYLKNRIGNIIRYGKQQVLLTETEYDDLKEVTIVGPGSSKMFYIEYKISSKALQKTVTLSFSLQGGSNNDRFIARLYNASHTQIDEYDSSQTYVSPTPFQTVCKNHDGNDAFVMDARTIYIRLSFHISVMPTSMSYDYEGYHYPSVTYEYSVGSPIKAYIRENFYQYDNLEPYVVWGDGMALRGGYSTNGEESGSRSPMYRVEGKNYKDVTSGNVYKCLSSSQGSVQSSTWQNGFELNPSMGFVEWIRTFLTLRLRMYSAVGWYIGNDRIYLDDYGLGYPMQDETMYTSDIFDTIEFQRVKWLTPQQNLMPEVFIRTDGERRFYEAHNYYPLSQGTPDTAIGEENKPNSTDIVNPIYKENETDTDDKHYHFENEHSDYMRVEHIEDFDDIKPTIKEQTNTVDNQVIRIDVVEEFAYDALDNDEIWENANNGGTSQGEYKHPYFFAKLRPLGFNIFDMALQEDMVVSMTTGHCGACNFRIGVDENRKKNPVQLWEYDVYGGPTFANKGDRVYKGGDLRRYVDVSNLYYDTNGQADGYVNIRSYMTSQGIGGGEVNNNQEWADVMYNVYTTDQVTSGEVGTTKQNGMYHFEGDVVTSGKFMDIQQDTTSEYVWVALMKDTDTYGVVMPSAHVDYADSSLNRFIEPKGINYTDRNTGQSSVLTEDEADKFVFVNIAMPQTYLRYAERLLSRKLVEYMYKHNAQKYVLPLSFSRIFLEDNEDVDENLNENSVVYVLFNARSYRQYVKHYTYKMSKDASLPEITIDTNDELDVTMNLLARQMKSEKSGKRQATQNYTTLNNKLNEVSKTSNTYIGGGGGQTIIEQRLQWGEF